MFALISLTMLAAPDGISLFNGKDLTGWKANNDPTSFRAEDGVIRVQAVNKTAHLFYVGDGTEPVKFKNFELNLKAKAEPDSNSGIYFHSSFETRNALKQLYHGYELQLNSTAKEKRKTGSLYAIKDLAESPVDETKWFTVKLVVDGKRIRVSLDGKECLDWTEPENHVPPKDKPGRVLNKDGGGIALQAHDPKSVWYFKDIVIKTLP